MKGDITFGDKGYRVESFACALALTVAAFLIIPLSIAMSSSSESALELTRVYSGAADGVSKGGGMSGGAQKKTARTPSVETENFALSVARGLDFSKVAVAIPSIAGRSGNFEIAGFESAPGGGYGQGAGDGFGDGVGGGYGVGIGRGFGIAAFELSELDKIPKLLNRVSVQYPPQMLRRGIEGRVRLNVIIDEEGGVEVVSVADSTNENFNDAAIRAASKMQYETPVKNGKPARAAFVLPIPFTIIKSN